MQSPRGQRPQPLPLRAQLVDLQASGSSHPSPMGPAGAPSLILDSPVRSLIRSPSVTQSAASSAAPAGSGLAGTPPQPTPQPARRSVRDMVGRFEERVASAGGRPATAAAAATAAALVAAPQSPQDSQPPAAAAATAAPGHRNPIITTSQLESLKARLHFVATPRNSALEASSLEHGSPAPADDGASAPQAQPPPPLQQPGDATLERRLYDAKRRIRNLEQRNARLEQFQQVLVCVL